MAKIKQPKQKLVSVLHNSYVEMTKKADSFDK